MCRNLIELPTHDFDIILCMDFLHRCYAWLESRSRVVRFCFPDEEELVLKGLLCHLLSVNDLNHDIPSINSVPVVNEFIDVFPEDLPGVPPRREIDYGID